MGFCLGWTPNFPSGRKKHQEVREPTSRLLTWRPCGPKTWDPALSGMDVSVLDRSRDIWKEKTLKGYRIHIWGCSLRDLVLWSKTLPYTKGISPLWTDPSRMFVSIFLQLMRRVSWHSCYLTLHLGETPVGLKKGKSQGMGSGEATLPLPWISRARASWDGISLKAVTDKWALVPILQWLLFYLCCVLSVKNTYGCFCKLLSG